MLVRTLNGYPLSEPFKTARVKPRAIRNGFTIHAYNGSNGGGKTLAAVYDSLPGLAAGRPIVSTCRILDPATGEPHPLWIPLDDFRVFLELSYCEAILDEVTGIASANASASLPHAVRNLIQQMRKRDVNIRWSTPNWRRADTSLREVTQAVTTCVGLVKSNKTVVGEDGLERRWSQRKAFVWRTYDAKDFDEWSVSKERSSSKAHRAKPVTRQVMWGPGLIARECYDTYETALTLGIVSEGGICMDCGGGRSPKKCKCDPELPATRDDSRGMLRWREVDAARRGRATNPDALTPQDFLSEYVAGVPSTGNLPAAGVHIPETDDTPGVVVAPAPDARECVH